MSEAAFGLLPFGGAKSGNNQLLFGNEEKHSTNSSTKA